MTPPRAPSDGGAVGDRAPAAKAPGAAEAATASEARQDADDASDTRRRVDNAAETEPLLRVTGLKKYFPIYGGLFRRQIGSVYAVDGVDFDVRRGESFGFLGPNGAGKSSTMRMIGCVSPVSEGVLQILGMDPNVDGPKIRGRLGVVPQEDTLDVELTVRENLLIYGRYFDLPRSVVRERADRLLEFVQLDH
ncbi:MAG TPA: ABC transporter ATP-binding protein, partial [Candidatus Dormibacteraeota bacterium]|nr:ABC transporter ATP-binding protein [Candidatus Dormibacteraeota bacterium]